MLIGIFRLLTLLRRSNHTIYKMMVPNIDGVLLWLTTMHCEHLIKGKHIELAISIEQERKFNETNNLFKGALTVYNGR
jgi:hypothetical protein